MMGRKGVLIAVAVALAAAGAARAGDLASNGGFEKGTEGWAVTDMSGTLKLDVDRKVRKAGKAAGHVLKTGGFAGDWIALPVEGLPAGKKVTITAWVKGKSLGNCWLKFFVFDATGESVVEDCDIRQINGSFGWKKLERKFSLPETAVRGEVRLCLFLGGEAWIDEVRVSSRYARRKPASVRTTTPGPDEESSGSLIGNGGFENGTEGWKLNNASGTLTLTVDRRVRKEGGASGHVVKTGRFTGDWIYRPVDGLPAGKKVTVTAWVKGKDLGNCWLKFFVFDASGESIVEGCDVQMLRGTFDWRKLERTFSLPEGAVRAEIRLCMFLGGEVWIDGVRVTSPHLKPKKELDSRTGKWLDANATAIATLDFDAPFDDLAALKKTLKDVRIVQLGESSHGDGATQLAKARLVRFLHEEMGFAVLAFESGLYECDRANALLREGKPREAMKAALFKIWCLKETEPLFAYMAKRANTDRPLVLAGFDPQRTGEWADRFLDEVFEAVEAETSDRAALKALLPLLDQETYAPDGDVRKVARDVIRKMKDALAAGGEGTVFLERCLGNFEVYETLRAIGRAGGRWERGNLRDARMADNLRWLAEVRYPGKKIITWAATFHQAHDMTEITVGGDRGFYKGCRAMGEMVHETFGEAVYTIGFCSYGGSVGRFALRGSLARPKEGSIEDLLHRYGKPLLFLNLRKRGPFDKRLRGSPMAHNRDMTARWPKVLDALFYIEEMTATMYMGND